MSQNINLFYLNRYGRPGVEFYGEHQPDGDKNLVVTKIVFLPGQGRLVTLTDDNSLHLWEINGSSMKVKCSWVNQNH